MKHYRRHIACYRAIAVCSFMLLAGCSNGLVEQAFRDDVGMYIVSRMLVNGPYLHQHHIAGVFACKKKYAPWQIADLQKDGSQWSLYFDCEPIERYLAGAYR